MGIRLAELARHTQGRVVGDAEVLIDAVCTLHEGRPDAISFLANPRYRKYLPDTRAGAVILSESDLDACSVPALVVDDPYVAYARIAQLLYAESPPEPGVAASAVIAEDSEVDSTASIGHYVVIEAGVVIGPRVSIGPGCVVGKGARIGADSRLLANVTLYHGVQLGERVRIHSGAVIGSDGFGLANDHGRWIKLPQVGSVRIGDDVEIGANTSVDRGAVEDTVIEEGVKLDNLIQVAHNVHIGAHTAIAGCTAIAGSARIGKHCMIGGAVGITGHLEIADRVIITAMSLVTRSISEAGTYSSGMPVQANEQWNKTAVRLRRLDDMARRLIALENEILDKG